MSAISDLLKVPSESFVRKNLPAASYLCQIVKAELLGNYWKASDKRPARWMLVYVPTIKIVDVIPTNDEELDAQISAQLAQYGDWQGKEIRYAQYREIPGYGDKKLCASIEMAKGSKGTGLNFVLADTTAEWESLKAIADSAPRFYTATNSQGVQDGWVVKCLSKDPTQHIPLDLPPQDHPNPLELIVPATEGAYLVVDFVLERDDSGQYDDKLMVGGTSSV